MEELQKNRSRVIVRTSMVGIAANLLLAAFKAAVGLLSNSIAVVLDAVNNLSDALSSVVTIIGAWLAGKKPDSKHPLGYGRIEYLGTLIVAALVLYAGVTAGVESVKKIIRPETPDYSPASLIIIASAVLVKVLLGRWVSAMGKRVNSGSLIASGADALNDAILSASVLASALVFHFTGLSLEPYVGVVIAVFIIKAGVEMIQDAIDDMLGKRVDREFLNDIRRTVCEDEAVSGAYDLILHSYGPEKYIGSVHVEVPSTMTADEIDRMERRITAEVYRRHGVVMAGVGIYSASPANSEMWDRVIQIVRDHAGVLQVHGFYADEAEKSMTFDIILDFDLPDRQAVFDHILGDIQEAYPGWTVHMTMDIDF
ncbi:MAG: cation transporter [Oscillospiraceae bacterium]|nr:cation transporter [Oscillospiraceae bacterium]